MSSSRSACMSELRMPSPGPVARVVMLAPLPSKSGRSECTAVALAPNGNPAKAAARNLGSVEKSAERALELERVEPVPESLWQRIRAEPERTPEYIALAAAERFAPAAERWVALMGPGREPAKVARIAYRKHVRLARLEGGALGIGGAFTAVPDLVALLWIQSRLTFYVAAAYGYDPTH